MKKELDSCSLCFKYSLFCLNFIYFAAGCAALGIAIWIIIDKDFMSVVFGVNLMTVAAVVILICAGIIILVSFFGCIGAIAENKCMLLTYFMVVTLVFLMMVIGGVLALVYRSKLDEEVRAAMRNTLRDDYGVNLNDDYHNSVTVAWDTAQSYLQCCAVDDQSWSIYKESEWYKVQDGEPGANRPYVPESCCVRDQHGEVLDAQKCQQWSVGPPGRPSGEANENLHYRGCYEAGKDFVEDISNFLIVLGLVIGVTMITGMAFSIYLYIQLSRY